MSGAPESFAPLIAVIGCDGSGKSTVANDIVARLRREQPAELCYLGLKSGDLGNRIKRFPVGGKAIEAFLSKKAGRARTKDDKIPGLATALVIYAFSLARLRRFRRVLALRRQGVIVVTDRYPQMEVPGFYDGPGLSAARAEGPLVKRLADRERRMYEWMTSYTPDLVIRLNVDVETAFARKPDHKLQSLKNKVAVTPLLRFGGAPIVDLDSRNPYPAVLKGAWDAVRATLAAGGITVGADVD